MLEARISTGDLAVPLLLPLARDMCEGTPSPMSEPACRSTREDFLLSSMQAAEGSAARDDPLRQKETCGEGGRWHKVELSPEDEFPVQQARVTVIKDSVSTQVAVPGEYAPQLLDWLKYVGCLIGVTVAPAITLKGVPEGTPPWALISIIGAQL